MVLWCVDGIALSSEVTADVVVLVDAGAIQAPNTIGPTRQADLTWDDGRSG